MAMAHFCLQKHVDYIKSLDKKTGFESVVMEHLRMSGAYWGLTALDLMGRLDDMNADEVVAWLLKCQHDDGGFGGNYLHDSHVLYTLSAVQLLALFDRLDAVDADRIASCRAMTQRILESEDFQKNFQEGIMDEVLICPCRIPFMVFSLPPSLAVCPGSLRFLCLVSQSSRASLCPTLAQNSEVLDSMGRADIAGLQNEDGSFAGDEWGEIDTRFSYCAICCLSLLKRLNKIDLKKATDFVASCKNFDGGFGCTPGGESHAGQTIGGALHHVDKDLLGWWLCERQVKSGGLNGRPEKLPDVCYSWWVLASLVMMDRVHWIDKKKLEQFILECQDPESGGISDGPNDAVDVFHTFFGVAGLSLLEYPGLKAIDPAYALPVYVVDRLFFGQPKEPPQGAPEAGHSIDSDFKQT